VGGRWSINENNTSPITFSHGNTCAFLNFHNFLSDILSIRTEQDLGDGVWEDIARGLGYTPLEIDMKFKDSDEPFMKLLNDYKKRGGSANDFISAMYSVGRNANLSSFEKRLRDVLPSSDVREVEDDVAGCAGEFPRDNSGITLIKP
jgi:hypothetical protein